MSGEIIVKRIDLGGFISVIKKILFVLIIGGMLALTGAILYFIFLFRSGLTIVAIITLVSIIGYFVSLFLLRSYYRKKDDKNFKPIWLTLTTWEIPLKINPQDKKLKKLIWITNIFLALFLIGALLMIIF